ncbi:MAG: FliA/WhiG family RNA polymerase sigma factor, partial [Lentisphaeraceae bacterium]|nr:FliA/WhiG family RNA polymerase sigma factor [Lentisphaeraceae bacterium]
MNRLKAYKKNKVTSATSESELWNSYLKNPSQDIHEKLVSLHLPLVFKQVERLSIRVRQQVEKDELVGAGVVGLHSAISKFSPGKDASFSTFASFRIKGALIDELRKQDHLTRNQRTLYKKICATI